MKSIDEQPAVDFSRYPPVGQEDWNYAYATARARVLEALLLTRSQFMDIINAADFSEATETLTGTDYAFGGEVKNFADVEVMLLSVRSESRALFVNLIENSDYIELLRARQDFTNMRLAVRRVVTGRPIGVDYCDNGNVPASEFEEIFEQENYSRFPDYLQEAVEQAILGYYNTKDIRMIDHGIDKAQAEYKLTKAGEMKSTFLLSLFRTQVDLNNIRTMLRLKMAERDDRDLFVKGGYVEVEKLVHGLLSGYETLANLFESSVYSHIIEGAVAYLTANQSFLALERMCEEHVIGFLKTTQTLSAGPQTVTAYFLRKENEIRTMRMVLTGKYNGLDTKLLTDRLGDQ